MFLKRQYLVNTVTTLVLETNSHVLYIDRVLGKAVTRRRINNREEIEKSSMLGEIVHVSLAIPLHRPKSYCFRLITENPTHHYRGAIINCCHKTEPSSQRHRKCRNTGYIETQPRKFGVPKPVVIISSVRFLFDDKAGISLSPFGHFVVFTTSSFRLEDF